MKALVFGPSGSGKTYISHALRDRGISAFDADEITGYRPGMTNMAGKFQNL